MLVVIGIALLLMGIVLPAVNRAYNQGVRTRMAGDLQAIAAALEAYRQDHGDIPRIYGSGSTPNHTGGVVLCKALIAPQTAAIDGQEGFGFRTRPAIAGVVQGKAYGPYLATDKFKIDNNANTPQILDRNGKAILYFPGFKTAQIEANNGYIARSAYTGTTTRPMFNANDNSMALFDYDGTTAATGLSKFQYLMGCNPTTGGVNGFKPGTGTPGDPYGPPEFTGDYLLWSAGPDERYGLPTNALPSPANKCDDVANFPRGLY